MLKGEVGAEIRKGYGSIPDEPAVIVSKGLGSDDLHGYDAPF